MFKKIFSNLLNVIIAFSCLFAIAMFVVIIAGSLQYWNEAYKSTVEVSAKLFWCGLLVAILYSCGHFSVDFIRGFANTIKRFYKNKKEVK